MSLVRRERSPPRPGFINQAVTVEVQRAGQTRLVGTSCWHDAGIVVRAAENALTNAKVHLDALGEIRVRVFDNRGTILAEARVDSQAREYRASWMGPPPNKR
jgi:hypothetical protein